MSVREGLEHLHMDPFVVLIFNDHIIIHTFF